ncbi:hypothetical protein Tco_0291452 [Tanacetum coccineum]
MSENDDDQNDDNADNEGDNDQDDDNEQTESNNDDDDFVHPKLSTFDEKERQDEEDNKEDWSDDEAYDEETQGGNDEKERMDEEETNEEEEANELKRISDKRTKNEAKNDKTEHRMEKRGQAKVKAKKSTKSKSKSTRKSQRSLLVIEDTHVIITAVTPEVQQQSSSVSPGFISNMLNPNPNTSINSILNLNTESTSLVDVPSHRLRDEAQAENEDFINTLDENIRKIIKKQVKEQVKEQVSKILPKIKKLVNDQLKAEVLTHSSNEAKTSYAKTLYKALVDAYETDKDILETYGDTATFKRHQDNEDEDEEPSTGSNRGSKRRRVGKEPESTSAPKEKTSMSSEMEPIHVDENLEEPAHQEFDIGLTKDQPVDETTQHPDWNEDPRKSFNELMDTHLDFSAFVMNRINVDTLKLELLVGPTYELMNSSCKSLVELEYFREEVCKAITNQLDWNNPKVNRESAHDVYSKHRILAVTKLKIVEWHNYKHLDWITVRRNDDKLYTFKEGDYNRLRLQDIEDMLLLLVQGKLKNLNVEERLALGVSLRMFTRSIVLRRRVEDLQLGVESYQKKLNLTRPDTYRSDLKRKTPYTAYSNPKGFIYQNKDKKNRLMRIDELHKFSDGTLNDVRSALDDILKRIRMEYLPQTVWRNVDRERAGAMIQAIDRQLRNRRLLRSLEKFVCGEIVRGRPSTAGKDHMIYHMMSSLKQDCDGIPKRLTMYLNLWSYKVVRHRYSNPMIYPEPEGSTQGYPLDSIEVLRCSRSYSRQAKEQAQDQKSMITTSIHKLMIEVKDYEFKTKVKA